MIFNKLKSKIINFPDYEIVASDIDKTALGIAKAGVYGEYSIHEIPKNYLKTHFTKRDTQLGPKFTLNDDIKNKVELIEEDIINGHKKNTKYDVIFCRNLLIYINRESKEKLLRTLENHLIHGGLLILGKTEMLVNIQSNFKSIDTNNHFYVKSKLNPNIKINKRESPKHSKKPIEKKENKPANLRKAIKKENAEKIVPILSEEKTMKIKQHEKLKAVKNETENHIESRKKILDNRELQVIRRLNQIELREKQLNERESKLKQREVQLVQKELLIGLREQQIEDLLEQIEEKERKKNKPKPRGKPPSKKKGARKKALPSKPTSVDLSIDDADRIVHPNIKGELNLPVGHYAIINSHDNENKSSKFSVYGLGSGIVLILQDKVHKVYAMSYMIHPKSTAVKKGDSLFPHRYIDSSVSVLLDKILYNGANKDNLEALIIGGANNIYEQEGHYQQNIEAITQELFSHHISIEKEFLGGISERSIIYDTTRNELAIKKKWESHYRKVS